MNPDWVDGHNIPYTARIVFMIGAVLSFATIVWSIKRVPELPLAARGARAHRRCPQGHRRDAEGDRRRDPRHAAADAQAGADEPVPMVCHDGLLELRHLRDRRSVYGTADATSSGFHAAVLTNGEVAAFYNGVAFVAAFAMVPLAKRIGAAPLHAACLVITASA